MEKRNLKEGYSYGKVFDEESRMFKKDLYERIGVKKAFAGKNILDLGCGYGIDSAYFSGFAKSVVGLDIDEHPKWNEYKSGKVKFVKGDSSKIPFKDNSFDGVFLKDLLHHVDKVSKTLDEIKRVTKKDGVIIIAEGNRYNPLFYFYVTRVRGHDHFTQSEFKMMVGRLFPDVKLLHIEAYPPFTLPKQIFSVVIALEKIINKIFFLKPLFSYNVAIIKNRK